MMLMAARSFAPSALVDEAVHQSSHFERIAGFGAVVIEHEQVSPAVNLGQLVGRHRIEACHRRIRHRGIDRNDGNVYRGKRSDRLRLPVFENPEV